MRLAVRAPCGLAGPAGTSKRSAPPETQADGDHQEQAQGLHDGADRVHPEGLGDPAIDHARHQQQKADGQQHDLRRSARDREAQVEAEQGVEVLGDHLGLGGDGRQARADDGQPDHIAEPGSAIGALGGIGSAAGLRVPRSDRGIADAGQQRRGHGHEEGDPDRAAHDARGLADQTVDARPEHGADAVQHELDGPDGALEFTHWVSMQPGFGTRYRSVAVGVRPRHIASSARGLPRMEGGSAERRSGSSRPTASRAPPADAVDEQQRVDRIGGDEGEAHPAHRARARTDRRPALHQARACRMLVAH